MAFRVDASLEIGTGHVMRCLTLADALAAKGAVCHFVMRAFPGNLADIVRKRGHEVSLLPLMERSYGGDAEGSAYAAWMGATVDQDLTATAAALAPDGGVDWLMVDHYALDERWERAFRDVAGHIMVIDDLSDRPHDCDILIDQNLGAAPDRYIDLTPPGCALMLGPAFALLRPEFARLRRLRPPKSDGSVRLLIFMGGIDASGATRDALEAVASLKRDDMAVDVVLGRISPHFDHVAALCERMPNVALHPGGADMATLMVNADISIGAAGSTAWERCCLGVPTLTVTVAANQEAGAEALAAQGAAIHLGRHGAVTLNRIAVGLDLLADNALLRGHVSKRARELVDGRGVDRVVRALAPKRIDLRRADAADCDRLWAWRNAESTRLYARDPSAIPLERHRRWFAQTLVRDDVDMLIGSDAEGPIGVIRYDMDGETARVSIFLVPGREGDGRGTALLLAGERWLSGNHPSVGVVEAEILCLNGRSRGAFVAAGFRPFAGIYRRSVDSRSGERVMTGSIT